VDYAGTLSFDAGAAQDINDRTDAYHDIKANTARRWKRAAKFYDEAKKIRFASKISNTMTKVYALRLNKRKKNWVKPPLKMTQGQAKRPPRT